MKFPDPEQLAYELLKQTDQNKPPVDLDRVVSTWPGVKISIDNIEHEGYIIDLGTIGAEIIIKAADTAHRQRYTIAHEIGHWILYTKGVTSYKDSPTSKLIVVPQRSIEKWCDKFAASLLMPQNWLVQELRSAKLGGLLDTLISLPEIYQVSQTAFKLRISEVTPVSMFEVKQRDGQLFVERRYETKRVSAKRLSKTLEDLIPTLSDSSIPIRQVHPQTKFISVYSLLYNNSGRRKWNICILPNSSLRKTL